MQLVVARVAAAAAVASEASTQTSLEAACHTLKFQFQDVNRKKNLNNNLV
jgi:hypothetical protein